MDEDVAAERPPPRYVLDAGCGAGIIGICAAAAILAIETEQLLVRTQDRDELARRVTLFNAEKNHIPSAALESYTEPLLAGPENARWDLILSNIPAKAGTPVLEDFIRRSAGLLKPGGRVIMVAVHTLADFFREQIKVAGAELIREETSTEHSVFVYHVNAAAIAANGQAAAAKAPAKPAACAPLMAGVGFLEKYPFYIRNSADYQIEEIPLHLKTVHGASGFDDPGGAVLAVAKLIRRLGPENIYPGTDPLKGMSHNWPLLIHESGQGFFPCWLLEFLRRENRLPPAASLTLPPAMVLSGRNILALEAARHNTAAVLKTSAQPEPAIVPAVDLRLGGGALLETTAGQKYGFIAVFPELLPQSSLPKEADQLAALWQSLTSLLAPGGVFIAAFGSTDAERFDRKKPAGFIRLGDIKRKGFRALGYKC
ncbi:hypothetical protein AGMMS50293_00690 [Spirochaetia bacterium]|nr:hypothetical protein AGMMS50293_00690 [Spirochaetia bacterium]